MGADLIGWRGCPLQEQLETDGFLGKLKLRSYLTAIESQVPPDKRADVTVSVLVNIDWEKGTITVPRRQVRGDLGPYHGGSGPDPKMQSAGLLTGRVH